MELRATLPQRQLQGVGCGSCSLNGEPCGLRAWAIGLRTWEVLGHVHLGIEFRGRGGGSGERKGRPGASESETEVTSEGLVLILQFSPARNSCAPSQFHRGLLDYKDGAPTVGGSMGSGC